LSIAFIKKPNLFLGIDCARTSAIIVTALACPNPISVCLYSVVIDFLAASEYPPSNFVYLLLDLLDTSSRIIFLNSDFFTVFPN